MQRGGLGSARWRRRAGWRRWSRRSARDNHLVARKLADNPRRLVASPAYLAERGTPQRIEELSAHQCLLPTNMTHWEFAQGGKRVRQRVGGAFSANSIEAIHQACLGGLGIANLSSWDVDPAIRSGALVEVELADGVPDPLAIWAVYPTAQLVPAKVRAFIDALDQALREMLAADGVRRLNLPARLRPSPPPA
ncbi:DNA-binding transcriptional LysR family regulator [Sphingomonas trueperi]|uniref:substrate binding domain-containing protein n=1 Tax=Sphingomonas trueperi TaxID=53317 RepID=UPI0033919219